MALGQSKAQKQLNAIESTIAEVFGEQQPQYEISVYVPSTVHSVKVNSTVHAVLVDATRSYITRLFGGTTSRKATGTYASDDGTVIKENITLVSTIVSPDDSDEFRNKLRAVRDYSYYLGALLQQESILVTITPVSARFLNTRNPY